MSCLDPDISRFLPDYHSGHLSAAERDMVEKHIETCQVCREDLRTMSLLVGKEPSRVLGAGGHIPPSLLERYYTDESKIDERLKEAIVKHLGTCDECSFELRFLQGLEEELRRSVSLQPEAKITGVLAVAGYWLWALAQKPAFAYAVLVIAIVPSVFLILHREQRPRDTAGRNEIRSLELSEQFRSGGTISEIYRSHTNEYVGLTVPFYHLYSESEYQFSVTSLVNSSTSLADIYADFSTPKKIKLIVDTGHLDDGDYALTLAEVSRTNRSDTTRVSYQFRIITMK